MVDRFPVLTFHALDDLPAVISFPPRLFAQGIAFLHECGYRTLTLENLVDCVVRGDPLPQRSLTITFDDGYRSVYEEAFPILRRYGFSATVFLTTGEGAPRSASSRLPSMSDRAMLSWSEIGEMHRHGMDFGAHTLTHPDLTRLSPERMEIEICGSRKIIEDVLGETVSCFAYPYGRYDSRGRRIVRRRFRAACSDKLGLVHGGSDVFAMERVDAYYLRSPGQFRLLPSPALPWYVRGRNLPRQFRRLLRDAAGSAARRIRRPASD